MRPVVKIFRDLELFLVITSELFCLAALGPDLGRACPPLHARNVLSIDFYYFYRKLSVNINKNISHLTETVGKC